MKKTPEQVKAQLALCDWLLTQKNLKASVLHARKLLADYQFQHVADDPYPDEQFNAFWDVYPKKVGKGDAYRKWRSQKIGKQLGERIVQSVRDHMRTERWSEEAGKYIPNPATYLHQKRYDDEVDVSRVKLPEYDVIIDEVTKVARYQPRV